MVLNDLMYSLPAARLLHCGIILHATAVKKSKLVVNQAFGVDALPLI
jgi:hypothetical protein